MFGDVVEPSNHKFGSDLFFSTILMTPTTSATGHLSLNRLRRVLEVRKNRRNLNHMQGAGMNLQGMNRVYKLCSYDLK